MIYKKPCINYKSFNDKSEHSTQLTKLLLKIFYSIKINVLENSDKNSKRFFLLYLLNKRRENKYLKRHLTKIMYSRSK